jgi:A/G-specific adenine glycosylase
MDYGAYLKKTVENPGRRSAHHSRQSPFIGSRRQLRGAVLKLITASQKPVRAAILEKEIRLRGISAPKKEFEKVLASLASEGFVKNSSRGLLIS